jgi:hypothetical protein
LVREVDERRENLVIDYFDISKYAPTARPTGKAANEQHVRQHDGPAAVHTESIRTAQQAPGDRFRHRTGMPRIQPTYIENYRETVDGQYQAIVQGGARLDTAASGTGIVAYPEITYKDFSRLAKKRGWTAEMLVELFKGEIGIEDRSHKYHEPLASLFERVLSCRWLNPEARRMEDRRKVVIPYGSIVAFYLKELHAAEDRFIMVEQPVRRNRHGGQRQGAGRKKVYATHAEKVHEYRKRKKPVTVYTKSSL